MQVALKQPLAEGEVEALVVRICSHLVSVCHDTIVDLRGGSSPFIRASIREPVRLLYELMREFPEGS